MKFLVRILSVVFLLLLALTILIKPVSVLLTKKQLGNIFVKSQILIGRCTFQPRSGITLFDIDINRSGVYSIKIKEATVGYSFVSVFKSGLKLSLKGTSVYITTPEQKMQEFFGRLKLNKKESLFKVVNISDLSLNLNTQDLTVNAALSLKLNLAEQSLDYLDLTMSHFKIFGVYLEDTFLKLSFGQGDFKIGQLKYDKLSVNGIKGNIRLQGAQLSFSGLKAKVLNGDIEGELYLKIGKEAQYAINLKCTGLDTEKFVQDFEFGNKFNMAGMISGNIELKGKGAAIEVLGGNFSAHSPGGMLVIIDTKFLENIALSMHQPVDLLVESFKDYHYNVGIMNLSLENNNVLFKISLDGKTGKRNLNVVLHDFGIKKEGR